VNSPVQAPFPGSEIAQKRREQILEASEAIIASEGLPRLSLGQIEKRTGMSRGQLTYYFPTKEAILLAVHERMLRAMIARAMSDPLAPKPGTGQAWDCATHVFTNRLGPDAIERELFSLLHTFLAQMNYRDDYRKRMAETYAEWRGMIAGDFAGSVPEPRPVNPMVLASIIQALINGLSIQLAADPVAFDRGEMAAACLQLLAPFFGRSPAPGASP